MLIALGITLLGPTGSATATGSAPPVASATTVCVPTDPRLLEASGMVRLATGFAMVSDGGDSIEVLILDDACQVTSVLTSAIDPYDVEDLAAGPDGTLWLADTGDNRVNRQTVAVEILHTQRAAVLHRLRYPDGPHDAEAMVVDDEGRVVIVAKTLSGRSGVYQSPPLDLAVGGTDPVELVRIGEFQAQPTGTPGGPIGPPLNNLMVTGAARCPELVALRTYTDAYLFPQVNGPGAAIVSGSPEVIGLPVQPQGESIALSADCATLYLHSEGGSQPILAIALDRTPSVAVSTAPSPKPSPATDRWRSVGLLSGVVLVALIAAAVFFGRVGRSR